MRLDADQAHRIASHRLIAFASAIAIAEAAFVLLIRSNGKPTEGSLHFQTYPKKIKL